MSLLVRLPCLLLLLLGWVPGAIHAQTPSPAPAADAPGTRTLTAEALSRAGITRLSDLFSLLDGWHTVTVDGHTLHATTNGLAPLQRPDWLLLVDGQPVDLEVFGAQNINTLPLHLDLLDHVEVHPGPTHVAGVFAPAGVLHLHTRRPPAGWSAGATFAAGNEINDPGPFRYTPLATRNIDRTGPHVGLRAGFAMPRWHVQAGLKLDEHHVTDLKIGPRVYRLYQGPPQPVLRTLAPSLTAGLDRLGQHRLVMGYTRMDDLRFLPAFGQEIPTDYRFTHVGLRGTLPAYRRVDWRYQLGMALVDHDDSAQTGRVWIDWWQARGHALFEGERAFRRVTATVGLRTEALRSRTGYQLAHRSLVLPSAYGRAVVKTPWAGRHALTLQLTRVPRPARYGLKVLLNSTLSPRPGHALRLTTSYSWQTLEEDNSLWYWIEQGYGLLDVHARTYRPAPHLLARKAATADLAWAFAPHPGVDVTLAAVGRLFFGQTLATHDPVQYQYYNTTSLHIGAPTQVWGGRAEVRLDLTNAFQPRLFYAYTRPVVGRRADAWEVWSPQPRHMAGLTAPFVPFDRFSLHLRARYVSGTRWPQYLRHGIAPHENAVYPDTRPAYLLADVTAYKRFWGDHLQASLSLQNATNAPYQPHPAGAAFYLTFFARLTAQL